MPAAARPYRRAVLLALATLAANGAEFEKVHSINSRATLVAAAPDGTVYIAGSGATIEPTPGAYLTSPDRGFLMRLDPPAGKVLYATYLNLVPQYLAANGRGEVCVARPMPGSDFPISPGAYYTPEAGRSGVGLIKLDTRENRLVFSTQFGTGLASSDRHGIGLGPDGSVYLAGFTGSGRFPVTQDAYQVQSNGNGSIYLARLSPDGSRLLYSTLLGGSVFQMFWGMSIDPTGRVYVAGATASADFPATSGTYSGIAARIKTFIARWNPESGQFDYIAVFGTDSQAPIVLAPDAEGRVAIASSRGFGMLPLPTTLGALRPSVAAFEAFVLMFNATGSEIIYCTGIPAAGVGPAFSVRGFSAAALDVEGNLLLAGRSWPAVPPTAGASSLDAPRAPVPFVMKLNRSGTRLLYSTSINPAPAEEMFGVAIGTGTVFFTADAGASSPLLRPGIPAAYAGPARDRRFHFYASHSVVQGCRYGLGKPVLYWDTRDQEVTALEVRAGAPDGPLIGSGLTGAVEINPGGNATYFLQDVSGGKPLSRDYTLATERISIGGPEYCTSDGNGSAVGANPNPVLSCTDGTGTQTRLSGSSTGGGADTGWSEIHLMAPDGPLFTRGTPWANEVTGDWVSSGMPVYLMRPQVGGGSRQAASNRVFTLPIRSCGNPATPIPPGLSATPGMVKPCGSPGASTLAWYSAGFVPIEIRAGSADGQALARFNTIAGLFEFYPTQTQTYYMVGYEAGTWKPLASVSVQADRTGCTK